LAETDPVCPVANVAAGQLYSVNIVGCRIHAVVDLVRLVVRPTKVVSAFNVAD
jgi:hypothetical protein